MNSEFTIAVHSLVYLAYVPEHMASSEEIAGNVCTHPARIRKVMGSLRKAGYVETKEGLGGGYFLARDAEDINLGSVYRLISAGSLKPGWCSGDASNPCMVASNITDVMDDIFGEAEAQLIAYFHGVTILDLLERLRSVQAPHA